MSGWQRHLQSLVRHVGKRYECNQAAPFSTFNNAKASLVSGEVSSLSPMWNSRSPTISRPLYLYLQKLEFTSSRSLLADSSEATPISSPSIPALPSSTGKTKTQKAITEPSKVQVILKGIKQLGVCGYSSIADGTDEQVQESDPNDEIQGLKVQIQELKVQLQEAEDQFQELDDQFQEAEDEFQELEVKFQELEDREDQSQEWKAEIRKQKVKTQEMKVKFQKCKVQVQEAKDQFKEVEVKFQELEDQFQELEDQSREWKVKKIQECKVKYQELKAQFEGLEE